MKTITLTGLLLSGALAGISGCDCDCKKGGNDCNPPTISDVSIPSQPVVSTPRPIVPILTPTSPTTSYLCRVKVDGKEAPASVSIIKKVLVAPKLSDKLLPLHRKNSWEEGILTVYFTTNSWTVYQNDLLDISAYARTISSETNVILEGYADLRGSEEQNLTLGTERAAGVEEVLRRNNSSLKTSSVSYGESKPTTMATDFSSLQVNRRVKIVPNQSVIARGLDLLVSDYYLIDQSKSMNGPSETKNSKWKEVQNYSFPSGAIVYTFTTSNRTCGGNLSQEYPQGTTPLFSSNYELLEKMEPNKSVTVLTDGCNNEGTVTSADVLRRAKEKNITVSFLALVPCIPGQLEQIARETGGKMYSPTK